MSLGKRMTVLLKVRYEGLTEEVLYIISGLSTTKQMWKALEEVFGQDIKDENALL